MDYITDENYSEKFKKDIYKIGKIIDREKIKEIMKKYINKYNEYAFKWLCHFGCVKILELYLDCDEEKKINVHASNEYGFRYSCSDGHLKLVKFLLYLDGDRKINVHENNEEGFRAACVHNHIKIVKLLLSLNDDRKIDIGEKNHHGFRTACQNGNLKLVELLLISYDKIFDYDFSENKNYFIKIDDQFVKCNNLEICHLLYFIKFPIDLVNNLEQIKDLSYYRKEIQLMCIKQTLFNLCCVG